MKNNCDASGQYYNRPLCTGPFENDECQYYSIPQIKGDNKCNNHHWGNCSNLKAIKAALRAKEYEDSKKVYEGNGYTVITHGDGKFKVELDIQDHIVDASKKVDECSVCKGTGKVSNRRLGDYCPTPEPCKECNK